MALLDVNRDGTVHLLQSLFSVLFGIHSTVIHMFELVGELMEVSIPPVLKVPAYDLHVWCYIRVVPWAHYHQQQLRKLGIIMFAT